MLISAVSFSPHRVLQPPQMMYSLGSELGQTRAVWPRLSQSLLGICFALSSGCRSLNSGSYFIMRREEASETQFKGEKLDNSLEVISIQANCGGSQARAASSGS